MRARICVVSRSARVPTRPDSNEHEMSSHVLLCDFSALNFRHTTRTSHGCRATFGKVHEAKIERRRMNRMGNYMTISNYTLLYAVMTRMD